MTADLTPHAIATDYVANQQWPVFACRAADEDLIDFRTGEAKIDPTTGEVEVAKVKSPYPSNGLKAATRFQRIIDRWWSDHPDAMIGIPTGEPTGVWVLDVDVSDGKQGEQTLAAMIETNGPLPDTRQARTASGGRHYYFKHHPGVRNRGGIGAGLDVRGDAGYVIAPGSVTAAGVAYEWLNDLPFLEAPQWLLDLVLPPPVTHSPPADYTYQPGGNDHYVESAVRAEMEDLASCPAGGRGYQLNASAFSLGTLVGAGALSRSDAESHLLDAANACGVLAKDGEREVRAKIKRGLDAGVRQPRHIPESEVPQDDVWAMDLTKFLANARAKIEGRVDSNKQPDSEPAKTSTKADAKPDSVQDSEHKEPDNKPDNQPDNQPDTPTPDRSVRATPFSWIDPKTLPRRDFVYGKHLIRKYVSVTVSPGGLGKTSLTISEALAMVSNKPLLGTEPPHKLKVWLFNAEDPRDEMDRRIMATAKHYKLKPSDLQGLFLDTGREQDLIIAIDDKRGVKMVQPVIAAVIDQITRNNIDVMIVDPFVSTHSVSENDNGAIDKVAKMWARIADETNCAIELVHHVRKSEGRDVTVEDARGAVSLLAAARSARVLNRMTDEQANAAGVPTADRFSYFSVSRGKANLAPMSGSLEWRRLQSVELGNGRGLTKPQDHAGVVVEWQWPGSEEVAGSVTAKQLEHIKTLLDNGQYKQAVQSKEWAGLAVAYGLGLEVDDPTNRKRVGVVLKALLKEGELVVTSEKDPVSRKLASFIRSSGFEGEQ